MPYHLCIQVLSYCCMIEVFLRPQQRFDDANTCNNACYQEKCKTEKGLTQNQNISNIGTIKSLSFLFTTKRTEISRCYIRFYKFHAPWLICTFRISLVDSMQQKLKLFPCCCNRNKRLKHYACHVHTLDLLSL